MGAAAPLQGATGQPTDMLFRNLNSLPTLVNSLSQVLNLYQVFCLSAAPEDGLVQDVQEGEGVGVSFTWRLGLEWASPPPPGTCT